MTRLFPRVAVVGAGVSGLICGIVLAESGFEVTLLGERDLRDDVVRRRGHLVPVSRQAARKDGAVGTRVIPRLVKLAGDRTSGVSLVDFHVLSAQKRSRFPKLVERNANALSRCSRIASLCVRLRDRGTAHGDTHLPSVAEAQITECRRLDSATDCRRPRQVGARVHVRRELHRFRLA